MSYLFLPQFGSSLIECQTVQTWRSMLTHVSISVNSQKSWSVQRCCYCFCDQTTFHVWRWRASSFCGGNVASARDSRLGSYLLYLTRREKWGCNKLLNWWEMQNAEKTAIIIYTQYVRHQIFHQRVFSWLPRSYLKRLPIFFFDIDFKKKIRSAEGRLAPQCQHRPIVASVW